MITLDLDLVLQLLLDQQGSFAFARITHLQEILRPNTESEGSFHLSKCKSCGAVENILGT